ncbi:polysaccharide pyruvyl transferase family protein [Peribacillus frigoritolerans]|uniref:polysaccharide pyruvyl transferase family protein n=1 Tax=Peribacillus frigoritolerans TaxID=450367 RepID=UPI002B250A9F|nr:polysaccharide pyruvyl transferase family protein [Peribacillus frigoritolerans]MEB2492996.1 polysaccharide pyruvyl transferase family protein [Peribacillus frigoritolerans]
MKKIMVYAYTHFNLGDDLFIKVLCERYPNTRFVLFAPSEYKQCLKGLNNISLFPNDVFFIRGMNYIFRKLKINNNLFQKLLANRCDAAVFIGGSLFIQGDNWEETVEITKSMRIKNKPFYLLGANFGPFNENEYYYSYKGLFSEYSDICFREKYSYDLFKDLSNVRMADDIIFQYKKQVHQEKENNIIISVINPSTRKSLNNYDEIYYSKIKDIAIYFIERGYAVTLMSFCEIEGDKEAIEKIVKLIPKRFLDKVSEHYYKLNIEETINLIAKSSLVVATRFHSMILGWVFNIPVFPIVYSDKMTNVMSDVGFKGFYTDIKSINSLKPEQVFESTKTNLIDVSTQVKSAEMHFEKLDKYLSEGEA